MLRPLVKHWRSLGIKVVLYIDDGIVLASSEEAGRAVSVLIQETLDQAGFLCRAEKCSWTPTQSGQWLGFSLNLQAGTIAVPEEKLESLKHQLLCVRANPLSARALASIIGKIISMSLGIGPISRFRTRSLYALLDTRRSWSDLLQLNTAAREEIEFWLSSLEFYNGQTIWVKPSATRIVYSDASDSGYGGYVVEHGPHVAHGQWSEWEARQSSTWRELAAVDRILDSVAFKLRNNRIKWFTDNQNVVRILQVGSSKEHLQVLAVNILRTMIRYSISLEPEWLPRESNMLADYLSRIVDVDDWGIGWPVFYWLDSVWGPHLVDRFASEYNAKCFRFNSRFLCAGSEVVDAFTARWGGVVNWICPPISLVSRVIGHIKACACQGTLVVPAWRSAPFWPLLFPRDSGWASWIMDVVLLPWSEDLILPGRSGASLPRTDLLAVRFSTECSIE